MGIRIEECDNVSSSSILPSQGLVPAWPQAVHTWTPFSSRPNWSPAILVCTPAGNPSIYDFIVASAPEVLTNTDKGWLQTTKSVSIAARTSFTQRSPTCAALRPKVTSRQASSNAFNIVDSAYPGIANRNGTYATDCSCVFKNTGRTQPARTLQAPAPLWPPLSLSYL